MAGFSKLPLQLLSNHTNPIYLAALGLLMKCKESGERLPQYSERLLFNVFNRLLSPQAMRSLETKDIYH